MSENTPVVEEEEESNDLTWWQGTIIAFVIGTIFYASLSSIFSDWSQATRLDNLESYSVETREMVENLSDRIGKESYGYTSDSEFQALQDLVETRIGSVWDSLQSHQRDLYELDEKLGYRIKDWTKK